MRENTVFYVKTSPQEREKTRVLYPGGSRIVAYAGIILFGILLLNGCATYHPKPLRPGAVSVSLTPPERSEIQLRAAELKHPLLKPVKIDFADGLSPDEAAIVAVVLNPALRVERDGLALSAAQTLQAGILPNPQFSYSLDSPIGGTTAGTSNAFTAGLGLEATALISRAAKIEESQNSQKEVNLYVAWQELHVAQAARIAIYRVRALKEQVALLKEIEKRDSDNLTAMRKASQNNLVTGLDLWAARDSLNSVKSMLISREKEINKQFIVLKKILGLPADYELGIQDNIKLPDSFNPPPFKNLVLNLEKKRLDLLALQFGYKSREAAVRAAVLEQFPKINIGPTHARDNSNLYTLGFGLSIDLPIFDRNQGHIAIERADRQKLFDEYRNRLFVAQSNIAGSISTLRALNRQIKHTAKSIVETNNLLMKYRQAIGTGQADILTYNNTWNTLTRKRLDLITLRSNLMETAIRLALESGYYKIESSSKKTDTKNKGLR